MRFRHVVAIITILGACGGSLDDDLLVECANQALYDSDDVVISAAVLEMDLRTPPHIYRDNKVMPPGFSNAIVWRGERGSITVFVANRSCRTKITIEPVL